MSQQPHRRRAATGPFYGLSFGTALAIFCAALATGVILSVLAGTISVSHLVLFALFALVLTLITEPKALFLFVALQPFLFGASLVAAGTFMVLPAPNGFGRTQLVTAAYPLTQFFPTMALTFVGSAVIAALRLMLLKRAQRNQLAHMERTRQQRQQTNQAMRSAAAKSRSQAQRSRTSGQVTVSELVERNKNAKRRRPASLDNPAARGARTYAPNSTRTQQQAAAAEATAPQKPAQQASAQRTSSQQASAQNPAHNQAYNQAQDAEQKSSPKPSNSPGRFSEDLYGD